MLAISLTIACSRYTYAGVILPAHPVRGESHNQRNTTGEVGSVPVPTTLPPLCILEVLVMPVDRGISIATCCCNTTLTAF